MKPLAKRICAQAAWAVLGAVLSAMASGCFMGAGTIAIKGKTYPLVFEDSTVHGREAKRMAADYTEMATREGTWTCGIEHVETNGFILQKVLQVYSLPMSVSLIRHLTPPQRISEWANQPAGWIATDKNGREFVIIPRALSDAYRQSFALLEKHAEAWRALPIFLREMNEMTPEKWLASGLKAGDVLCPEEGDPNGASYLNESQLSSIADWFGETRFEPASLLTVGELDGKLGLIILMDGPRTLNGWAFVFDAGRWKMFIPQDLE